MIANIYARRLALSLVLLSATIVGTTSAQNFDFRMAHLVTGVAGMDVFLNDRVPPSIGNLPFGYASALLPRLTSLTGSLNVKVAATGAGIGAQFISRDVSITGMNEYVGVTYGTLASPKMSVLQRSVTEYPAAGNALLRVLNATTMATAFDMHLGTIGGFPLFQSLAADANTVFAEVLGQPAILYITTAGSQVPIARLITPLIDGGFVTVIITGSNSTDLKCYALIGENPDLYEMPTLQNTGGGFLPTLRIVDALPLKSVPRIDVFVNGTRRTTGMNYHSAAEVMGPLTFDTAAIAFTPADEGLSSSFLNVNIPLSYDTHYVCILTQVLSTAPTPIVLKAAVKESSQIPDGRLKIRVANATEFFGPLRTVVTNAQGDTLSTPNLAFREYTAYSEMRTGSLSLKIYRVGSATAIFTSTAPYVDTTSGELITVILEGDSATLTPDVLIDSDLASQIPMKTFDGDRVGVDYQSGISSSVRIAIAPNPMSTSALMHITTDRAGTAQIDLYDVAGNVVLSMHDHFSNPGTHSLPINANNLPSGTYAATITLNGTQTAVTSVVVVK